MLHFTLIRKNHLRDLHEARSSLYKRIHTFLYLYVPIYTHICLYIHKLLLHIHIIGDVLITYANRFCQYT